MVIIGPNGAEKVARLVEAEEVDEALVASCDMLYMDMDIVLMFMFMGMGMPCHICICICIYMNPVCEIPAGVQGWRAWSTPVKTSGPFNAL